MRRAVLGALLVVATAAPPWIPGSFVTTPIAAAASVGSVSCAAFPTGQPAAVAPVSGFNALRPLRLIDTRDGTGGVAAPVGAGCTLRIDTPLVAEIPAAAEAVSLSVTSVDAAQLGYLTVYPCGGPRPGTSNVNNRIGVASPNNVVAALDSTRAVCIFSFAATNVVVDLFGWFGSTGLQYTDVAPVRAFDSRSGPRPDGGVGRVKANTPYALPLAGSWVPTQAEAVLVNLTIASSLGPGFLLAYPCGTDPPVASNVNFLAGEDRAGSTMVGLGPDGTLCLLSNVDVHIIVDVSGYFEPAKFGPKPTIQPLGGLRVVDSRTGIGGWSTPLAAGETRAFDPTPNAPAGDNSYAAMLNVIATGAAGAGHLRVFPCAGSAPLVSTVNFSTTGEATNLITVAADHGGLICVFASTATQVVIDEFALLQAPGLARRLTITGAAPFPTFDPTGQDYAMICPAAGGDLSIDALGTSQVDVTIDGVSVAGLQTRHLATDHFLTVRFTRGADVSEYTLRCLPSDFPPYTVDRPGSPQPGWYLGGLGWSIAPTGHFLVILDNHGAPIWYKRTNQFVLDLKMWTNGNLAWTPQLGPAFGTDINRGYRVTSLDGSLVAELKTVGSPTDHHDLVSLPGDNRAMITYPRRDGVDLTDMGLGTGQSVVDGEIQELAPNGTVLWFWNSVAHFNHSETTFVQRFQLTPPAPNGGAVDLLHINSIDRQPNGDYIVSARHLDSVFRIDHATGNVLWKLGGTAPSHGAIAMTIIGDPVPGGPHRMHDARLGADGILTVFDNESGLGPARVVAYQLDETLHTATFLWQRVYPVLPGSSFGLGSARRNPDGSLVISWGSLQPLLEELDSQGHRLLAVTELAPAMEYRFIKVPPASFDRQQLLQLAGGTAQGPP